MATTTERNPLNVQPVVDGQVLVSFAEDPKIGLDGHFGDAWATVGILNDGSKLELKKAIEKNKTSGWGFGVIAVSTKPGELTAACEVLENNETVQKIAWPTATKDGILFNDGVVAKCHVAFVETLQDGTIEIKATRHKALATMEDLGRGEEVEGKTIDFDIMPGPAKDVFDRLVVAPSKTAAVDVARVRFAADANETP